MLSKSSSAQITLRDVAKASGVSFQTVSRVINNGPGVASKTRRRVLEAVEALGYQPNLVARSLKTRRSSILEVIIFGVDTFVPRELMEAIERTAKLYGYRVTFSSISGDDLQAVQDLVHRLKSRASGGAIITAPVHSAAIEKLVNAMPAVPIVQIRNRPGTTLPSVIIDQQGGSRLAVQYLIDLGHREIAELRGPEDWHEAALRHESFLTTLAAHGLQPADVVECSQWMPLGGYQGAHELLDRGHRFSALVTANDYLALGAILALTERGLRIPEDVSVVGFDDTPEAAFFRPPLTTIRQDYEAMGHQCIQYLLDIIENPETPVHQRMLVPQLIERQSVRSLVGQTG